jgi:hypothetical protein
MNTFPAPSLCPRFRAVIVLAALAACWIWAPTGARAGLTLEMNVVCNGFGSGYYYTFFPNLGTNSASPNVPFGDYFVASPGYPTNGANVLYRFDATGFNQVGGGNTAFNTFDAPDFGSSLIKSLTNGLWSIYVTNTVTTNVYHFSVTANLGSNSLPHVVITFPTNGAVNVTNQPVYAWQGPPEYSDIVLYEYNQAVTLPAAQTRWASPQVLYQGPNGATVHYDNFSTNLIVASVPLDNASHPISSWVSTGHQQTYFNTEFTVGAVDLAGTGHILVARYAWDTTNSDGSPAGTDSSSNSYDLNFSGSSGGQGGVDSTTDAAAGPRAIQFHDGDGGSAGFAGWNPTPPALLGALAGSFSISCWIKTTQNYAWDSAPAYAGAGIVSADNPGLANDVIPLALTGSKIGFNTGGDVEDVTLNSTASVNDGNYHHVVVTRNQQTGQKIIYIDGLPDSFSSGTTNLLNAPRKLTLGALADASDPNANHLNYHNGYDGLLDDLQIYFGVLSSNEVAQLYASPGTTAADVKDFNTALNTSNLVWTTTGDANWFLENTNTHASAAAAQSGSVTGTQISTLTATVTGPGTVTFYWSSIANDPNQGFDCEFYIDDSVANDDGDLQGNQPWQQAGPFTVGAGQHTLNWTVTVNGDTDPTEAAYLDQVVFTPIPAPTLNVSASPRFGPVPLTVQFTSPSVDSQGNAVTSWNWNFGDGVTSTNQNPTHTYNLVGGFPVGLAASSANALLPVVVSGPGTISITPPPTNLPGSPASFTFNNFNNGQSMRLNGDAALATTSDGPVLELTPASPNRAGSAFTTTPVPLAPNAAFSSFFAFRLHQSGGVPGNDGITFTIQGDSSFDVGGSGGQLGYSGIPNSLSVEFDTSAGSHVAVNSNGHLTDSVTAPVADPLNNGNIWYAWLDYSGVSKMLEVRLSEVPVRPLTNILAVNVDLPQILGNTNLSLAGNILTNGDFEYEPNYASSVTGYDPYASALVGNSIPGWTVAPNHAATIHKTGGPYLLISGEYSLNTDGEGYGGHNANLYQDFHSTAHVGYTLNFNWQSWGYNQPIDQASQLKVTLIDTVTSAAIFTGLYSYEGTAPHPVHVVNANFTGTGNPLRLRIEQSPESGRNDQMFVADNFSIVPTTRPLNVYAGFTGGTGAGWNQEDILSWKFKALPTARYVFHHTFTNVPAGFQLTNGVVLKQFIYTVNNIVYTNIYLFIEEFTEEPDGSVDAETEPESTPVIDENNADGGDESEDVAVMDEYVGSGSVTVTGVVANPPTSPPDGTPFEDDYSGASENDVENDLTAVNNDPPAPSNPTQNQSPAAVQNLMNTLSQEMNEAASTQEQINQEATQVANDIGYSNSRRLGIVTLRQQLISAPPLRLTLVAPGVSGTNFNFSFLTVSNQSYTVWSSTNLAAGAWTVCTNFSGSGYTWTITIPATNTVNNFYRASSP